MKSILLISGPALGHVTRLVSVARQLSSYDDLKLVFAIPSISRFAHLIEQYGFYVHRVKTNAIGTDLFHIKQFGVHMQALFDELQPDVVVFDCNMLIWTGTLNLRETPSVMLTNVFITKLNEEAPFQEEIFQEHGDYLNRARSLVGLSPLSFVQELYEKDLVCLSDPSAIVDLFGPLPAHYRKGGACFWKSDQTFDGKFELSDETLLSSMGSTGRKELTPSFIQALKTYSGAKQSVYAGHKAAEYGQAGIFDEVADFLPLEQILPKCKLVLTQGGAGSTYQALSHGVPVAVLPSHKNQASLGILVDKLGAGILIEDVERICDKDWPDFSWVQAAAQALSSQMRLENGPQIIAENIAAFTRTNSRKKRVKQEDNQAVNELSQEMPKVVSRQFRYSGKTSLQLAKNTQHQFALRHAMKIYPSNACYTYIPKNGCSTMRFSVAKANGFVSDLSQINWIHSNNQTSLLNNEGASMVSYTFAILRCPLSRLYSAYVDKIVNMDVQSWELYNQTDRQIHPHDLSFRNFVLTITDLPPAQRNPHWREQTHFLLFKEYDDLFCFERFSQMAKVLKLKIGLDVIDTRAALEHDTGKMTKETGLTNPYNFRALRVLNMKRDNRLPAPEEMFDQTMLECIRSTFRDDIDLYVSRFGASPLMEKLF